MGVGIVGDTSQIVVRSDKKQDFLPSSIFVMCSLLVEFVQQRWNTSFAICRGQLHESADKGGPRMVVVPISAQSRRK